MPTVLKINGFRFFFFSDEHLPMHIHVEKADGYMRVELETMKMTHSYKFSKNDEKKIIALIEEHRQNFIGAWNDYFNIES